MTGIGLTTSLPGASMDAAGISSAAERGQAKKIAQDFEGLFLSMLVKEMRQTSEGEGLFPGDQSDTLGGMFDMFMGEHLSESGGFGIADKLESTIAAQIR